MDLIVRKQKSKAKVDITSLIDIIFLLVIFFMIASSFITVQAIEVGFESRNHAQQTRTDSDIITVQIMPENMVKLDDELLPENDLAKRIDYISVLKYQPIVKLYSNEDVTVQRYVGVMDQIRQGGITNITITKR